MLQGVVGLHDIAWYICHDTYNKVVSCSLGLTSQFVPLGRTLSVYSLNPAKYLNQLHHLKMKVAMRRTGGDVWETMLHNIPPLQMLLTFVMRYLSQLMRLWYSSHRRPAKAQVSLHIHAVLPEPLLFVDMKYGSRGRVQLKIRHLTPLDGCACAFED